MHDQYTETEIKLYAPDLPAVAKRLAAAGAVLSAPRVFERNVRYENAENSLTARRIVLRLRQDTRARLTYKEDLSPEQEDSLTRYEAEVEVSDFDAMDSILQKLGFRPYMTYEKYRTTYLLDEAEIVLDEMPFGNFVEIEGTENAIEGVMAQTGLNDAPRMPVSYAVLFDRLRDRLRLQFTDMTFENFAGVAVSFSDLQDQR